MQAEYMNQMALCRRNNSRCIGNAKSAYERNQKNPPTTSANADDTARKQLLAAASCPPSLATATPTTAAAAYQAGMASGRSPSDTNELRTWLNKRKSSLEQRRLPFESLWKDIREYYEPTLGKGLLEGDPEQVASQRDDEKILNTTPRLLLHRMAAGLQSGITNQSRRWFNFAALDNDLTEYSAVRQWLDSTAEAVSSAMNRSNVYPALDQTYLHLGQFGTAAGIIYPDDENTVHLRMIDCGNYWLGDDKRGRVTSVLERISMTLDQVVEEFGKGWTPDRIIERIKNGKGDERVTVWHLVQKHTRPDLIKDIAKDRKFMSIYWLDGQGRGDHNDGILAIRSFSYNPIIAPRWWTNNSVYGIGCGQLGLGDTKQLQQLEADKLRLVELEVDPPMQAPASMKGTPIETGAGGLSYYGDFQGKGAPVTRLFETRQQIQGLLEAISATEQRLRQTFYADLFALMINLNMQPKQMTAREVNELSSEKVACSAHPHPPQHRPSQPPCGRSVRYRHRAGAC